MLEDRYTAATMTRRARRAPTVVLLALLASVASLAGSTSPGSAMTTAPSTLGACRRAVPSLTRTRDRLTVGTDNPVSAPWFADNRPSDGQGFESALTYELARLLGFRAAEVSWVREPFSDVLSPGPKPFDLDVDEIAYSAARARVVALSRPYFYLHQALVALRRSPLASARRPATLADYRYGVFAGSPGATVIDDEVKPHQAPVVYTDLSTMVAALESGRIDALVIDVPTAYYMVSSQLLDGAGRPLATVVGQFAATSGYYSIAAPAHSAIMSCVDDALNELERDGTLGSLGQRWLGAYRAIPTLTP